MDLLTKVINKGYFLGEFESTILSREILSKEIARTPKAGWEAARLYSLLYYTKLYTVP